MSQDTCGCELPTVSHRLVVFGDRPTRSRTAHTRSVLVLYYEDQVGLKDPGFAAGL